MNLERGSFSWLPLVDEKVPVLNKITVYMIEYLGQIAIISARLSVCLRSSIV